MHANWYKLATCAADLTKILIDIPYFIYLYLKTVASLLLKSNPKKNLSGEVILLTGAASGIGQKIVYKFARKFPNAVYILWDINESGLSETVRVCQDEYGAQTVYPYKVDLSQRSEITKTAELVRRDVGTVTVLVNNAGLANYQSFLDTTPETEETLIKVNLLSYMWTIREFLPGMISGKRGHLVQTCSGLGFYRFSHHTAYCASKFGLRGFIESLKLEVSQMDADLDIKFSTIFPGFVKTPMTSKMHWDARYSWLNPLEADQAVEEMVDGILSNREEIMVPGGLKLVDIGHRLFPAKFISSLDAYLLRNLTFTKTPVDQGPG